MDRPQGCRERCTTFGQRSTMVVRPHVARTAGMDEGGMQLWCTPTLLQSPPSNGPEDVARGHPLAASGGAARREEKVDNGARVCWSARAAQGEAIQVSLFFPLRLLPFLLWPVGTPLLVPTMSFHPRLYCVSTSSKRRRSVDLIKEEEKRDHGDALELADS